MILLILLADSEYPAQTARMRTDQDLRWPHMPEDTFSHGAAQSCFREIIIRYV